VEPDTDVDLPPIVASEGIPQAQVPSCKSVASSPWAAAASAMPSQFQGNSSNPNGEDSASDASDVQLLSDRRLGDLFAAMISAHAVAATGQARCIRQDQRACSNAVVAAAYVGRLH